MCFPVQNSARTRKKHINQLWYEENPNAKWVLETILENAETAERNCSLCDDTGIPHLVLEVGPLLLLQEKCLMLSRKALRKDLENFPRPMAIIGDDSQRIDQSGGLNSDSLLSAGTYTVKTM